MEKMTQFGDMPTDDFRRYGYEIVDRLADYFERIEEFPVLSQIQPDDVKKALPTSAPEFGEAFRRCLMTLIT